MNRKFRSQYCNITLEITGYDEPNNGRELHVAELYVDGKSKTKEFLGEWNRLNWNIDSYRMDSYDGKFVFVPAEGKSFLIETLTLRKIDLPSKNLSTITFLKNEFTEDSLIITYTDEVVTVDLSDLSVKRSNSEWTKSAADRTG